ncbi:unnamed protein product [Closterium sp. Yama58-4]|nr:unnamed protein product [Closterium sp. Yama58-4]
MASQIQVASLQGQEDWEEEYRPLPLLFVCSLAIWTVLFGVWIWNTWVKRQWQTSYLQWALALVPALKCVVLGLSFFFWHWCLHFDSCSFWVAFGVFVSRIFFETTCFIMFLLIAHGLGITQDSLSMAQRRSIAGLSGMLYISITAYKAALPHFQIILTGVYTLLLYAIFSNVARRMGALQEQLRQAEAEGAAVEGGAGSALYPALLHRLALFRRFQGAMLAIVFIEIILQTKSDVLGPYWVRLQLREVAEVAVFLFIGWTFRSRVMAPIFMLLPAEQHALPPIHRVDMDDKGFQRLRSKDWTIGICTTSVSSASGAAGSAGFASLPLRCTPTDAYQCSRYHLRYQLLRASSRHPNQRRRRLNSLRVLKGGESSSMGTHGDAVRAALLAIAIVTVIAACLVQPSHAAGVLMGNVRLGTRMYIDGRELLFVSPCIDIPPITGVLPADARPANDDRWADCTAIRFFQDAGCTGPVLYNYDMTTSTMNLPIGNAVKSARCDIAGDVCKYARCPPNSKCDASTYDPNQSKSTTKSNLSGYIVECPCNEGYIAAKRRCQKLNNTGSGIPSTAPSKETPAAPSKETPAAPSKENPAAPSKETPAAPSNETPAAPSNETPTAPSNETPAATSSETPLATSSETPAATSSETP